MRQSALISINYFYKLMHSPRPIGIFDSGYGGLTVFKSIHERLPQYDYIYLGDNARAPYGNRSFATVYEYTLECVAWFFKMGCPLVILACNTASAKALRTIQKKDLPRFGDDKRVLGVIRPTAEEAGAFTHSKVVGVLGTIGTIQSQSYPIEIHKFHPEITVVQQACPMWVHLIENNEHNTPEAEFFIKKHLAALLAQSAEIDTILLACTHYPIIEDKIRNYVPGHIRIISQGTLVANSLADYLTRHSEMDAKLTKGGEMRFFTTDDTIDFDEHASTFFGEPVAAQHLDLKA